MIDLLKQDTFFSDKNIDSCTRLEDQGYCNENYLVHSKGKKYIARKLLRDDIDRNFEYKVQLLAFKKDITAEPLVFDKENGFMLFEFLEGEHKCELDKHGLKFLAKTLQKSHSIKIDAKPIKIDIENKTDEVLKAFETIENYPKEYVLCHNDLNPQNIFFADEVKFIDWEYAGVNDRYFDLASVCVEFDLNKKDEVHFLGSYFGRGYKVNNDKHDAYKVIYKALYLEWFKKVAK